MSDPRRALPRGDRLHLVIFDCDGVLFDSWGANVAFYDAVLRALRLPPLDEEGRRLCHTLSSPQLYAHLFGADTELIAQVTRTARATDYGPFYALMQPAPLLHQTLRRLAAHCPLALATNRGSTVRGVVTRFDLEPLFATTVGILDVARPKPAPDLLVACLERCGVAAEAAVYVGDTELDREAARAAGVAYVGIGARSAAAVTVRELHELPDLLLAAAGAAADPLAR